MGQAGKAGQNLRQTIESGKALIVATDPQNGTLLQPGRPQAMETLQPTDATVVIHPCEQRQTILGFGAALTDAASHVFLSLPEVERARLLTAWFDRAEGNAYQLLRIPIGSCDFSLKSYSFAETPGDYFLTSFDISPAREFLLPVLKQCLHTAGESLKIIASPWSPPPWMKTSGERTGGRLRRDCLATWAAYFSKYLQALGREGIPVWAITVQNEPGDSHRWESCEFSPEEERDFVKFYLGPRLLGDGLSQVKILVADDNRDLAVPRAELILADPGAARYVGGVAVHWYSGDHFSLLGRLRRRHPQISILNTEACLEGGVSREGFVQGLRYAHDIIGCLNAGCNGWLEWNILLDSRGGPNHANNYCDASVIAESDSRGVHFQSGYYFIAHFSRFIPPGSRILRTTNRARPLEVVAAVGADGIRSVVILNPSPDYREAVVSEGRHGLIVGLPPGSIRTILYRGPDPHSAG